MATLRQTPTAIGFLWGSSSAFGLAYAWQTGNALAASLGFLGACALFAHCLIGWRSVANIECSLKPLANRLRENEPFPFELSTRNRSAFFPTGPFKISAIESGRSKRSSIEIAQAIASKGALTLVIYPEFSRRGSQCLRLDSCESLFPFGFTKIAKRLEAQSTQVRIWPARISIRPNLLAALDNWDTNSWRDRARRSMENIDPNRLRDYRQGDSRKRVNWRLSAKTAKLIVRDNPERTIVTIFFGFDTHPRHWKRPERFEYAIRILASLLEDAYARRSLGGIVINGHRESIRSQRDLETVLDRLSEQSLDANAPRDAYQPRGSELILSMTGNKAFLTDGKGRLISL